VILLGYALAYVVLLVVFAAAGMLAALFPANPEPVE
jgi:hypothetical protein